jgi:hypothetical protein
MCLNKRPVIQQFSLVSLSPLEYLAHHPCRQRSGKEGQRINPECRFLSTVARVEVR